MKASSVCTGLLALVAVLCCSAPVQAADIDAEILQFALNLEYLEANFYSCVVYGMPLNASLSGGGPTPLGCTQAMLSPEVMAVASDIADDEISHVAFLRGALTAAGATPVAQPLLDIGGAFAAAANAAFNASLAPPFSPYVQDLFFLLGAYIFEDVGATAYLGAIPLITNKAYLPAAGGILGVEAYHAGCIRTLLFETVKSYIFPYGVTTGEVTDAISALRDAAAGTYYDMGILASKGLIQIAPVNKDSLLYARTTSDVLKIVYLGGSSKGGFFPNGLNGAISSA